MLIRRKIGKLLADYYAQPANRVVGSAFLTEGNKDINFRALWGEWHYRRVCARLYEKQEGRWLTPVELMRPFYSQTLGNFVAAEARAHLLLDYDDVDNQTSGQKHEAFDIVELGGGRATNASVILTHLQHKYPEVYERINSYTLFDASPSLLELQEETMRATGDHFQLMSYELKNMIDIAEEKTSFLTPSETPTVVLTCELLDNLPHDKVRVTAGRIFEQGEITKTKRIHISADEGQHHTEMEVFQPLSDPLLATVLKLAPGHTRSSIFTWIPTVACGVLHRLHRERPNTSIMIADFDWLPPPDLQVETEEQERLSIWASGEPIITDMQGVDHACYLQAPACCDILFPTDFAKLASFVEKSWKIAGPKNKKAGSSIINNLQLDVHKQSDFLQMYGAEQVEATKSWLTCFSPMVHDFANCSVLTVGLSNSKL